LFIKKLHHAQIENEKRKTGAEEILPQVRQNDTPQGNQIGGYCHGRQQEYKTTERPLVYIRGYKKRGKACPLAEVEE
jgi:hypothetical protein